MTHKEKLEFVRSANDSLEGKAINYTIHSKSGRGVLAFDSGYLYICQDDYAGCPCRNTHGYSYSYRLYAGNIALWDISFPDEDAKLIKYGEKVHSKAHGECVYLCKVPSNTRFGYGHLVMRADGIIIAIDDLIELKEIVGLNDSYSAIVGSEGITVGCQKFDFSALDRLVESAKKFRK